MTKGVECFFYDRDIIMRVGGKASPLPLPQALRPCHD
jgi:hypothetical protein